MSVHAVTPIAHVGLPSTDGRTIQSLTVPTTVPVYDDEHNRIGHATFMITAIIELADEPPPGVPTMGLRDGTTDYTDDRGNGLLISGTIGYLQYGQQPAPWDFTFSDT